MVKNICMFLQKLKILVYITVKISNMIYNNLDIIF